MKELEWTIALQLGPDILYPKKSGGWQTELNPDIISWTDKKVLKAYAASHINPVYKWVMMATVVECIIYNETE